MSLYQSRPIEILVVEDNPGDVRLMREVLNDGVIRCNIQVQSDGDDALDYLKSGGRRKPDLILLDLNLPRRSGREVLEAIKEDPDLRRIPVVVLTTSASDQDIRASYDLHANCFVTKPVRLEEFEHVLRSVEDFWCTVAKLPSHAVRS